MNVPIRVNERNKLLSSSSTDFQQNPQIFLIFNFDMQKFNVEFHYFPIVLKWLNLEALFFACLYMNSGH